MTAINQALTILEATHGLDTLGVIHLPNEDRFPVRRAMLAELVARLLEAQQVVQSQDAMITDLESRLAAVPQQDAMDRERFAQAVGSLR